ncbi:MULTISPECIES: restriction endonuclease subunit S [unclassified Micromonospora]|uniref:restriction endonuclease subunit S n=1 Tax=unclassified Micromonospora TaxID=2617518 RepID=UPI001C5DCF1F|nr:restriction endonuclease subunit S [Micromonospora sp. RL09-050-HVF-A]MBW4705282.1 restriction endonuclease subunit S [Micromonospora sp. RL09-050-HVF-A]
MTLSLDKSSWGRVALGDVAAPSREKVDPGSGVVDRYVAGEHMDTDDLKIHRWGQVGDGYLGPAFHRRFHPGQVLYGSRRAYLRKVAVADFSGITANTTFVVETRDSGQLLQSFLPFVMKSDAFHAFAVRESKGSVNPYLNWSDIARYDFELPPLDEQGRLAELLWSVERDRRAATRVVSTVGRVAEEVVDALLAEPVFPQRRISEVLGICQYGLSVRAAENGTYPMLRMTNLDAGVVVGRDLKYCELGDAELAAYRVAKGDVLFNRTNSFEHVGRSGLFGLDGDFVFASYLVRLRPDPSVLDSRFLNYFINSRLGQKRIRMHISKGVQQANISASKLKLVTLPLPNLAEQRKIVDRIETLSEQRDAAVRHVSAAGALYATLSRAIFGGER